MSVQLRPRPDRDDSVSRHRKLADLDRCLAHLRRLTDEVGLFEHADHHVPRLEHGYCLDDNARAAIVVDRAAVHTPDLEPLFDRYLRFVLAAQAPDGRFSNRFGHAERRWTDAPGLGDWWGRALWALGHVCAHRPQHPLTERARAAFVAAARHRTDHPRAMAVAAFGAAEMLAGAPTVQEAQAATDLLADAIAVIGRPRTGAWPWPGPRLTYANATLPEALIAAGVELRDATALADGLALLRWLTDVETGDDGVMSFTPVHGWHTGEPRPAFDQQPIEAWSLAAAAARALRATGDELWRGVIERCAAWFDGVNDMREPLCSEVTGGGCDGLTAHGRNDNQGAESTLALIATRQLAASCA